MTCANTVTLGAYLLGALDPEERFEFEAHLGDCTTCRTELVRLAPLPGMLNQISLDDFADGLPPTTLEDAHPTAPVPGLPLSTQLRRPEAPSLPEIFRKEASLRDEPATPEHGTPVQGPAPSPVPSPRGPVRRVHIPPPPRRPAVVDARDKPTPPSTPSKRRRVYQLIAAAAVALVLAAGVVIGWRTLAADTPAPEAAGVTWAASTPDGSATADARLIDHEWGTEIQMKIDGMPRDRECYLIVYGQDGYHEIAGWWGTDHEYGEAIPASTSIARSKIDRLELLLDDRTVVLTIPAQGR